MNSQITDLIPDAAAIAGPYDRWHDAIESDVTFSLEASPIHTRSHAKRVLLFSLVMGARRQKGAESLETLGAVAAFHDTRRLDDGLDVGHGARAAAYYRDFCAERGQEPDELAALIMTYHDRDDVIGEKAIASRFGEEGVELYRIFKDADGLDRFRFGPAGVDARFLRHPEAFALMDAARALARPSF